MADSSTVDGSDDLPPPPPMSISFPPMMASSLDEEDTVSFLAEAMKHFQSDEDEESVLLSFPPMMASSLDDEDAVSFLAEAMKHVQSNDDEESVLLLIAPKEEEEDGTEEICQFISAVGTPRSQMASDRSVHEEVADDDLRSNATSNNLASLFTNDECNSLHGTSIQIMDAVEVEGGYLLTPTGVETHNNGVSNVFRFSTGDAGRNLLLGSVLDSDDEDDDTLLYHDGCTAIQQAPSFGDHTIDTMTSFVDPFSTTDDAHNILSKNGEEGIDSPKSFVSSLQFTAASSTTSPSNASINSIWSTRSKMDKKKSPKTKSIPKSASKTRRSRGGLVKDRISSIHERIGMLSAASSDEGSFRYKHRARQCASIGSAKSSLSTNYIRSVPIGIAKSYSQDSCDDVGNSGIRMSSGNLGYAKKSFESNPSEEREVTTSYARKYMDTLAM